MHRVGCCGTDHSAHTQPILSPMRESKSQDRVTECVRGRSITCHEAKAQCKYTPTPFASRYDRHLHNGYPRNSFRVLLEMPLPNMLPAGFMLEGAFMTSMPVKHGSFTNLSPEPSHPSLTRPKKVTAASPPRSQYPLGSTPGLALSSGVKAAKTPIEMLVTVLLATLFDHFPIEDYPFASVVNGTRAMCFCRRTYWLRLTPVERGDGNAGTEGSGSKELHNQ